MYRVPWLPVGNRVGPTWKYSPNPGWWFSEQKVRTEVIKNKRIYLFQKFRI